MQVDGYKTETVTVRIDPNEVLNRIERLWLRSQPGKTGDWIKNGIWYEEVHTSHSWTEYVGPATDEQIKVCEAFATIREVMKNLK